jgi:hypothetical protein
VNPSFADPGDNYLMTFCPTRLSACLLAGILSFCWNGMAGAQSELVDHAVRSGRADTQLAKMELPDAPQPEFLDLPQNADQQPNPAAPENPAQGTSSSTAQATPDASKPDASGTQQKSKEELAEEQLKQQKKQRVFGFLPSFNTSYNDQAVSLTAKQKFRLAFTSATDPVQFGVAGLVSLVDQAEGSPYEYGGGIEGYAKRFGATYADAFDGAMIGNALLPSILHQDPRFFRRGYGSTKRRIFYAISTSFVCKHDVTGKWEPNYSNVLGNLAAGGISNFYAPESERGVGNTFEGAALVTVEGGAGAILQEFWPDISRHFFHKDPTHGRDAINNSVRK